MVSTAHVSLYVAPSIFAIGAFLLPLFSLDAVPSAVRCGTDRLLCCLIMGIQKLPRESAPSHRVCQDALLHNKMQFFKRLPAMLTCVRLCIPVYSHVYQCMALFTSVRLCLPAFTCYAYLCTAMYTCLWPCLPVYGYVYLRLPDMLTCVRLCIPVYGHVYLCTAIFTCVLLCLPVYGYVYLCME